jgi:phosphohistidine phosphatase
MGPETPVSFEDRLYDARAETLLEVLHGAPPATRSLMLVAHNPGIEELARALAAGDDRLAQKFPAAGLAVIDFPVDGWSEVRPGAGRLMQLVSPKTLAKK